MTEENQTLKISKIRDGIVIDHIPAGRSIRLLSILNVGEHSGHTISLAMRVKSNKKDYKDVVKIENRNIAEEELSLISLIAPDATISFIENYNIKEKRKVKVPETISGILRCPNQNCISNAKEPVETIFHIVSEDPLEARCEYCERIFKGSDLIGKI
ncbi:MAG: aspartate carbamoyltransferase regulatory subunit [Candidatus Thermoplasmatota archaeon]|nr:aspartate carbamoyltransferase regulatory subunit [Candidatus Thermoplasmatota archaeon]MCL5730813.1 aspartate carbamoyltransferase regulatory subunit [Candidatus Thermoplasmatota archaeon]